MTGAGTPIIVGVKQTYTTYIIAYPPIKKLYQEVFEVNIEQRLEFIKKALEMGANIHVKFHGVTSKKEAEEIASEFSEMLEIPYEESENKETYWFNVRDSRKGVDIAVFYELSKAEKQAELLKQLAKLNTDEEETA